MGRLFMDPLDDPFQQVEALLNAHRLGGNCDALILDFHGEATSEKMAMGHIVDGRVSLCVGTHTHVPTADHMILPRAPRTNPTPACAAIMIPSSAWTRRCRSQGFNPQDADRAAILLHRVPALCAAVVVDTDDATGLGEEGPARCGSAAAQPAGIV
jgi:hypothetical protein